MNFTKFKEILEFNKGLHESLKTDLGELNERVDYGDFIVSVIFEILKTEAILLRVPLNEASIGAIHFQVDRVHLVIINTNQPICKMNFSAVHELHHIYFPYNDSSEMEFDIELNAELYNGNYNERKASLFAASLMMPDYKLKRSYDMFENYSESLEGIIIKLMVKFQCPLEAVLLRLYELDILKDINDAKPFLELEDEQVVSMMQKHYVSTNIMEPELTLDTSDLLKLESQVRAKNNLNEYELSILMKELNDYISEFTSKEVY